MNIHSNTNRTITIYIKENTENYLNKLQSNVFLNVGHIRIFSYSLETVTPSNAIIKPISYLSYTVIFSKDTKYNIMKNSTQRLTEKLAEFTQLTGYDSGVAINTDTVITVLRTNMTFNKISFISEFLDITLNSNSIKFLYPRNKFLYMSNIVAKVSGVLVYSIGHTDIQVRNLTLDAWRIYSGFTMDMM